MALLTNEIKERVIELKTVDKLSNRSIQAKIQEELWRTISLGAISWLTSSIVKEQMEKAMPDEKPYDTREIDWVMYYVLYYTDRQTKQRCEYEEELEKVKSAVYDFSVHGWNLSQQEILEKYSWTWHFRQTLKNRLKIYKSWNVIDPVSMSMLEEKWEEAIDEEILRVSNQAVKDRYKEKFIKSYKTSVEKNWLAALKREGTRDAIINGVIDRVKEMWLPRLAPLPAIRVRPSDFTIETITDLHLGKQGTFEILSKLHIIAKQIVDKPQKKVYFDLLGDLAEIFVEWGRHPWQIEEMEWVYWFDLILKVVETLTRFIYEIAKHKNVTVIGIGWNHDVFSTAKEWDQARTAALVCYTMVQDRLRDQKNIEFIIPRDAIYVYDCWNLRNIIAHGDEIAKKSLAQIIIEYWDTGKYNVIKYGHLHYTHLKETSDKWLILWCPWLAWKGSFDKRKMLSSNAWHVSMEENQYSERKMPKIWINLQ